MKIFDITQEVFSSCVYPGDPHPERKRICSINDGSLYNLTFFSMCAHNGTHIDAPFHFLNDGKTVDEINLEKSVGYCYVIECFGNITKKRAENILNKASERGRQRILIKGNGVVTKEAALVFGEAGIHLIGVESQSVGPCTSPMEVHKILLNKEIVILEGIRLNEVPEGEYFLSAAPVNLKGADGAPCRAVLIKGDE